jgi:hypothetical protein
MLHGSFQGWGDAAYGVARYLLHVYLFRYLGLEVALLLSLENVHLSFRPTSLSREYYHRVAFGPRPSLNPSSSRFIIEYRLVPMRRFDHGVGGVEV